MSESQIQIDTLDNGLRAAFINMPHFRSTAARLVVGSGALHETPDTTGAAHFLEHVTFQGTEALPTEEAMHKFAEDNGIYRNAFTNKTVTAYVSNGFELEPTVHSVAQTALFPLLTSDALERERKPVIDELRGYASSPTHEATRAHGQAVRGELWGRTTGGDPEDIVGLTHEHLLEFYNRNYRLGNATLVVCSGASIAAQREYVQSQLEGFVETGVDQPTEINMAGFNPGNIDASLQRINLPESAQSHLSIVYDIPEVLSLDDEFLFRVVGNALSKNAHRRLRSELAVCYGASASANGLISNNFRRLKSWVTLSADVSLNGEDAIQALDALRDDVLHGDISDEVIESIMTFNSRTVDYALESNPIDVADNVQSMLAYSYVGNGGVVDLEAFKKFSGRVTPDRIRQVHRDIMATKPLVLATSPSQTVLDQVGDWAAASA